MNVERRQARSFLAKADEFIAAARSSLEAGRKDATILEAIHAAISATDAVTCALAGTRSTDPDHSRAADLLEEIGPKGDVANHARQLRQLLANKNTVEYESRRATSREAADAGEARRALRGLGSRLDRRREALADLRRLARDRWRARIRDRAG